MNKKELIEQIASGAGISSTAAEKALNSTLVAITDTLKKGNEVTLVGFGTFSVKERAANKSQNPQTEGLIKCGSSKIPCFSAELDLVSAIKGSGTKDPGPSDPAPGPIIEPGDLGTIDPGPSKY